MFGVHITLRMRLMCQIHRKDGCKGDQIEVLNEVVVDRGANPYLTKIECWEHDRLITKVGPGAGRRLRAATSISFHQLCSLFGESFYCCHRHVKLDG